MVRMMTVGQGPDEHPALAPSFSFCACMLYPGIWTLYLRPSSVLSQRQWAAVDEASYTGAFLFWTLVSSTLPSSGPELADQMI